MARAGGVSVTEMATMLLGEFGDLEPFSDWAQQTEAERYGERLASSMDDLQACYVAAFPRVDATASSSTDGFPDEAKRLLWLYCSLVNVTFRSSYGGRRGYRTATQPGWDCVVERSP